MKTQILILGLLISLLVGCDTANQNSVNQGKAPLSHKPGILERTEFDSVSFPKITCGDSLPDNPNAYPVTFYPVFIDYTESIFQSVTSEFCQDAIKKFREVAGKDAIQVASFTSLERANQFEKFMKKKFGSGQVGEPTLIEAKRTFWSTDTRLKPEGSIGESAKLTPDQVKQLMSLDNKNNSLSINFKVVLPTYIPPGFKVHKFAAGKNATSGPGYEIVYRNSSNLCFVISGDSGQWGGPPGGYDTVEVSSPALGKVVLEYTDFDRDTNKPYISFKGEPLMRGQTGYRFISSGLSTDDKNCGNIISLQEAVKVVKSIQYLNP
jgi:hypothetical protein